MKRVLLWSCTAAALLPAAAWAGGFEYPGNGTEAMGRGAAFTAKADDATAFDYNIAGFARQRGTRLLFDSNLIYNTYEFTRLGTYPDAPADYPYGGAAFPKVKNSGSVGYVPFIGLSSDFGFFDRWTFALGLFAPNSVSARTYPTTVTLSNGVKGAPAPQRYDVTKTNMLIAFPTLAAALRVTHWFDIGIAVHLVYANLDLANDSLVYTDACKSLEDTFCDSLTEIKTTALTASASAGLMFHPTRSFDIGVNVRPQINIDSSGKVYSQVPMSLAGQDIAPAKATFNTKLPTTARLGLRWVARGLDNFEHGDIEIDGDYENWSAVEGQGDQVHIPDLEPIRRVDVLITHHYKDTFSVRVGGAYNLRLGSWAQLSFRAGFFFDSAATDDKDTRVDFDTMAKYAPTVGLGLTIRGITLNVAYAYIWEPDRKVTNGDIQSVNAFTHGATNVGVDMPTPVVNSGFYHAADQMLSIGATIAWDTLLGKHRQVRY